MVLLQGIDGAVRKKDNLLELVQSVWLYDAAGD